MRVSTRNGLNDFGITSRTTMDRRSNIERHRDKVCPRFCQIFGNLRVELPTSLSQRPARLSIHVQQDNMIIPMAISL
jgi:hypothetical protein